MKHYISGAGHLSTNPCTQIEILVHDTGIQLLIHGNMTESNNAFTF